MQGAIAESHVGGGATTVTSLPTCQLQGKKKKKKKALSGMALTYLLPGARKTPARAGPHVPYTRCLKRPSLGPHLSCAHGHRLPCAFGATRPPAIQAVRPPLCPVLTGADPRAPRQPQDQTLVGGPHTKVGIKSRLNPRNGVTKEED